MKHQILNEILIFLLLTGEASTGSLDGYSFSCGGRVNFMQGPPYYGFVGDDEIFCPDAFGAGSYKCGSYSYAEGGEALSLALDDQFNFITGTFQGRDIQIIDGILISYMTDNPFFILPCTVQGLDWRKLEQELQSVFFSCRPQNAILGQSYEDNSFTLYNTGNIHFQSNLEITSGNGNTIRRDYHGVFLWDQATGFIKLYAGPQNGEAATVLTGTLSQNGELFIDGFTQENNFPCQAQSVVTVLPAGGDYPVPIAFDDGNNDDISNGNNVGNNDGNKDVQNNDNSDGNGDGEEGTKSAASGTYQFFFYYILKPAIEGLLCAL